MRERVPGFTKTITPKSMRRTNKDLLRQEGVSQLVAQSINSHHDPKMHAHYSTISDAEKTGALAKVIRLFPSPFEPTTSSSAPSRVADNVADLQAYGLPHPEHAIDHGGSKTP